MATQRRASIKPTLATIPSGVGMESMNFEHSSDDVTEKTITVMSGKIQLKDSLARSQGTTTA